jgi:hypothetical protein
MLALGLLHFARPTTKSAAPWNDGGRSFSTKERLFVYTKNVQQGVVVQEKGAFSAFSG